MKEVLTGLQCCAAAAAEKKENSAFAERITSALDAAVLEPANTVMAWR